GQKWCPVSTWRLRPRVEVIRGGGAAGAMTGGAGGACSHATHWGLWVRPTNAFGSLERGRRGRRGSAGLCGGAGRGLGQASGNMHDGHTLSARWSVGAVAGGALLVSAGLQGMDWARQEAT